MYLSCNIHDAAAVLRVSPDGAQRLWGDEVYALATAAANTDGIVAAAKLKRTVPSRHELVTEIPKVSLQINNAHPETRTTRKSGRA